MIREVSVAIVVLFPRRLATFNNASSYLNCEPSRHVAKGGAAGAAAPPWRPGGPFSARAARRKGPTRPREAQFLESLEVLRAPRALSERPEGPIDVQRAPVQVRGPPG